MPDFRDILFSDLSDLNYILNYYFRYIILHKHIKGFREGFNYKIGKKLFYIILELIIIPPFCPVLIE